MKNQYNINEICFVWDIERGLPTIRRFLILKIELIREDIYYTGVFQYEQTGDLSHDYGVYGKSFIEADVFLSLEECRTVAREIGDYHFIEVSNDE